jgi:hypothetical protein
MTLLVGDATLGAGACQAASRTCAMGMAHPETAISAMNWRRYAGLALSVIVCLGANTALAADRYTIGTNPQGTIYYTIGGAMAAALQDKLETYCR